MSSDIYRSMMQGFLEYGQYTHNKKVEEAARYALDHGPNVDTDTESTTKKKSFTVTPSVVANTSSKPVYVEDMIKEVRSITISYKGKDAGYSYRVAEMGWDSDIAEDRGADELFDYIEDEWGYDIERFSGYALVPVDNLQDYTSFKADYMQAKKTVIERLKHQRDAE